MLHPFLFVLASLHASEFGACLNLLARAAELPLSVSVCPYEGSVTVRGESLLPQPAIAFALASLASENRETGEWDVRHVPAGEPLDKHLSMTMRAAEAGDALTAAFLAVGQQHR